MGRPIVEGRQSGINSGSFPDLAAVVVMAGPSNGAIYRCPGMHRLAGFGGQLLSLPNMLENIDTGGVDSDHTWTAFLRGTGVPGGELLLGTVGGIAALEGESAVIPIIPDMLLPGQTIELEMLEAVDTNAPTFVSSFDDIFINELKVQGSQRTQILQEFLVGTDFVLNGPAADDDFQVRQVPLTSINALLGTSFVNADSQIHTMTATLNTPTGDVLLATDDVAVGAAAFLTTGAGFENLPGIMNLTEGFGITVATQTGIATRAPVAVGTYTDFV